MVIMKLVVFICLFVEKHPPLDTFPPPPPPLSIKNFPYDSWVTVELYIDYDSDEVYFSVPSLNHTVVTDTFYPLFLTAGGDYDDNPAELRIYNSFVARRNETIKGVKD